MTVTLIRNFQDDKQTLGIWSAPDINFTAHSMELAWKDNQHDISRIPATLPGKPYKCKYTRSSRLSANAGHDIKTYEILGVPNRAGIRCHPFNEYWQGKGCIALGDKLMDIDNDGELDVANSRPTVAEFEAKMGYADFDLIIIDQFNESDVS